MSNDKNKIIPILTGKEHSNQISGETSNLGDLDRKFNDPRLEESKDVTMVKTMAKYAKPVPQKNLSDVVIEHSVTRKTHLALVTLPKWAVYFAPYNIARLAAVTRAAGYKTTVRDFNADAWNRLKDVMEEDPWYGHGSRDYLWLDEQYENKLRPYVQPLLDEYLEEIVSWNPDVVGFSIYYTSVTPTFWMAEQLKQRLPGVKIIGGGSHIQWADEDIYGRYPNFDHVVKGEAEEILLEMLQKIEDNEPLTQYQYNSDFGRRINLDSLPFPDYSDMDVNKYMLPGAISSEFSRGCVAKCTFCAETLFWKYRTRQSLRVLDEVEHQHRTYGSNQFWFIDSLVNGNPDELRAFALGVVERGLDITWQGYCRSDDRMDYDYLKDLAASGCAFLNYGIESGSEPVLLAMKKNTSIAVVERNLRDCYDLGIGCATNWMLGFPNERSNDFARTMTLAWRVQRYITNLARQAMNLGPSRVQNDPDKFDIHPKYFLMSWATKDLANTKIHRLIRVKSFNILVDRMPLFGAKDEDHNKRLTDSYDFSVETTRRLDPDNWKEFVDIPYEDFDYEVIKDPQLNNTFKRTVVNEIWPLFRTLWRGQMKQALKITVKFDPRWDYDHLGSGLATENFDANYAFEIDENGHWNSSARIVFNAPPNPYLPWVDIEDEELDLSIDLDWHSSGQW